MNAGGLRSTLVLWAGLGTLLAVVFVASDWIAGLEIRPFYLAALGSVCSALWLAAKPAIWRIAGRLPLGPGAPPRFVAAHLLLAFAFAFALTVLFAAGMWLVTRHWVVPTYTFGRAFRDAVFYFLLANILFYALVVTSRVAHDAAARSERIQGELTRARLDTLRAQMNPHFLFNALNSVAGLVRQRDIDSALGILARIGDVLRRSLGAEDVPSAPLEDEVAAIEELIAIERCRFADRLHFEAHVDPDLAARPIPRWILQPLVENAVRHGLEEAPDAGRIELRAARDDGHLVIEIEDDGPGPPAAVREGIGLGNTRERLESLFGNGASLRLTARGDGQRGTRVTLRLPLQPAADGGAT